jgi:hypothetical protein
MPEPAYAVVELLCDPSKLAEILAIPNLQLETRPIRTPDPSVVKLNALADENAQNAARALGCTVSVVKSAEDYRRQVESAFKNLGEPPSSQ